MKKIILSLLIVIVGFLILIASSIYLADYNKIYADFIKITRIDKLDANQASYKINKFPIPYLVIDEIKQTAKIELKGVNIKFSLWSVLSFNHKISSIEIAQMAIHLSNNEVNYIDHDEFIAELIKKEALNIAVKIDELIFVESDRDIPFVIKNFTFGGNKKATEFTGELASIGNLKGEFVKNSDQISFNLHLNNPKYNIKLQEIYEKSMLKSGKMEITTSEFVKELINFVPDFVNLSDKFDSSEEVKISLDIVPLNQWINFKNIVINSASLQGTGEIAISKNKLDTNDIKINFSKIDLNNWSKNKNNVDNNNSTSLHLVAGNKFNSNKNQIKASIFAKQFVLSNNNSLADVNLNFLIQDGKVNIENFSGVVGQAGSFKANGVISENSFRSIFKGRVALVHENLNDLVEVIAGPEFRSKTNIPYSLISDIKLTSVDVSAQNLLIKTADSEISGSISTKFIGNSPRTNANLKFTKVNLDTQNLPVLNYLYNYGVSLAADSKKDDYLSKFIPIRQLTSINNYDIKVDQLIANSKLYTNVNLYLNLIPGKVRLENLRLNDGKDRIDTTIELIASGIKPSFNWIIHSGIVETNFLSPRSISELRKKILEIFALDKVDLNINFALNKIYQGDFALDDLVFQANNNKTLFEISKLEAGIFGGKIVSSGSILLDPYTINFVYALNSAIVAEIAKLTPPGMFETTGVISAGGMWSTNGDSLEEQLYNLYTKSNIFAKDITISNFSIDNFVQIASAPDYNVKSFQDDLKQALLTGQTSISEIKSDLELTKGLLSLSKVEFKTKYTSGAASANFNLYNLNIDLVSVLSFYLSKPTDGRNYTDYAAVKLPLKVTGNLLIPKKEADPKHLEDFLNSIAKKTKN